MARKPSSSSSTSTGGLNASTRVTVLLGPEEMLKREALATLRSAIEAAYGEPEVFTFDGKMTPLSDVLDELLSFSLMQRHKIVIVDDADVFAAAHRDALERYAKSPVDNATLVLRAVKWNKGNLDKAIDKVGGVHKFDPLPPAEVRRWLVTRAEREHGRKIDPRAAEMLADRLGGDLSLIDSELGKLAVMVSDKEAISIQLVEQLVGRSSEEQAWAVQEVILQSLASRRSGQVIEKLRELIDVAGQADVLVAYFVADLIRNLHIAAQMKRQGATDRDIASRMKLWGPREQLFHQVLRKFPPNITADWFDRVMDLGVRAKSGRGETLRGMESFFATLTAEIA